VAPAVQALLKVRLDPPALLAGDLAVEIEVQTL
jgi:hypothetical protein